MFSEKTDVPLPPTLRIFSFSTVVTLKIRPPSPKSNQFFVISQLYIHENLIRIQPLIHKIFVYKCDANADANTLINMSPFP